MLDPHKTWSRKFSPDDAGGPIWDVVEGRDSAEIQNHLNTLGAFDLDYTRSNDETIIRIPLRTQEQAKTSKIFQRKISIQTIEDAFKDFGQEIQEGGLLFLKHIRKIVIKSNKEVVLSARILDDDLHSASMQRSIPTDFKQRYAPNMSPTTRDLSKTFVMGIECSTKGTPITRLSQYVVQHTMMTTSGNEGLDIWAQERKLYPWVALAAPLKDDSAEPFDGRLFSTLRLPVRTNQPVHIHGLFSITPDRGRLSSSGQSPGYEDLATKWNTFMFEKCVAAAWSSLLAHRSPFSWREEMFALWPRAEFAHSELWDKLDDNVIDIVINDNMVVWNASNGRCVDVDHGIFASKDDTEAKKFGPALTAAFLPVVYLEGSLLKKLKLRMELLQRDVRVLTPVTARQFFRQHGVAALPSEIHSIILEFCLLDAIKSPLEYSERDSLYNDLEGIQIWPTVSGKLSCPDNADLILPRDYAEMHLFYKSRAATTLDLSMMTPPVKKLLLNDIKSLSAVMRFRGLEDLATDWPIMYPMITQPESPRGWAKRAIEHDDLLHDIWTWIAERVHEGQGISSGSSCELWLVPMDDLRIRKFAPKILKVPLLIIQKQEPLYALLTAIVKRNPLEVPGLLDIDILPEKAINVLRNKEPMKTDTQCTCIDDPGTFIEWLVAGKETLTKASAKEKAVLLGHLEAITRDSRFPTGLTPAVMSQMRKLPLYSRISCSSPFE